MGVELRKTPRRFVQQPAMMVNDDGSILGACTMLNVSATGALLKPKAPTPVPNEFILVLSRNGGLRRRCMVAWRSESAIGIRFLFDGTTRRVQN